MKAFLAGKPARSVTPDRGSGLAAHARVTEAVGIERCRTIPGSATPTRTPTICFGSTPKGRPIDGFADEEIQAVHHKLNCRLCKRHDFRTPYETRYSTVLQSTWRLKLG